MIPRLGRGGRGFDSRSPPFALHGNEPPPAPCRARTRFPFEASRSTRRLRSSVERHFLSSAPFSFSSRLRKKPDKKEAEPASERVSSATSRRGGRRIGAARLRVARTSPRDKRGRDKRGIGGIEPPTSSTRRTNHATRPMPQLVRTFCKFEILTVYS